MLLQSSSGTESQPGGMFTSSGCHCVLHNGGFVGRRPTGVDVVRRMSGRCAKHDHHILRCGGHPTSLRSLLGLLSIHHPSHFFYPHHPVSCTRLARTTFSRTPFTRCNSCNITVFFGGSGQPRPRYPTWQVFDCDTICILDVLALTLTTMPNKSNPPDMPQVFHQVKGMQGEREPHG